MSDICIPEAVAIDTARLINEIEDRRDEAAKDLKQVWGNLREHLKDIGLSGREISEQVGFLKGAIAETRKSDEDKTKANKKAGGIDTYFMLLTMNHTRARARAHEDQPHTMSMYLRKEDMPNHDPITGEVHDDQPETESGTDSKVRGEGFAPFNSPAGTAEGGYNEPAASSSGEIASANSHSSGGSSLPRQADTAEEATPPASSATPSAMTARTKGDIMRLLRPFCQHPDDTDQCGGQGSKHCTTCEKLKHGTEEPA